MHMKPHFNGVKVTLQWILWTAMVSESNNPYQVLFLRCSMVVGHSDSKLPHCDRATATILCSCAQAAAYANYLRSCLTCYCSSRMASLWPFIASMRLATQVCAMRQPALAMWGRKAMVRCCLRWWEVTRPSTPSHANGTERWCNWVSLHAPERASAT